MNILPANRLIDELEQININGTWLIVVHDAGAANIIASWLPYLSEDIRVCAQGPAIKIFEGLVSETLFYTDLNKAFLDDVQLLISGTGWQSSLEHDSRVVAGNKGVYSIAVVDHWANYATRFTRQNSIFYPDRIVVTDEAAYQVAQEELPEGEFQLSLWPNLYFVRQVEEIKVLADHASDREQNILYLLEPMRKSWYGKYDAEFEALDFFFKIMEETGLAADKTIVLRPHPSEPEGKYQAYLDAYSQRYQLRVDNETDLSGQIAGSAYVFGCCSFALVLADSAGKKVFCTIPQDVDNFRLPHTNIKPLLALSGQR